MNTLNGRNTGIYGPKKEYQHTQPPTDSPVGRRLRGYTHQVRSRAPAGKSKNPPDDSTQIIWGLGDYTHRVCSRAPSGKSNHPQEILSESPGGSEATPVGCAHAHPLASQKTSRVTLLKSSGGSGATVGDQY